MKKRFIVLIDFSEHSESLLKYAYDWSKQVSAEFLLLHQTQVVAPSLADSDSRDSLTQQINTEAQDKLEKFARKILPYYSKVNYAVSEKNLKLTLQTHLEEAYDDLVFVGIKETSFRKKIFLGSTVIELIDDVDSTVVAMPKEMMQFSHEKIFVAVTEKHPLNILELNNFLNFIDESKTNITFFHLADAGEDTDAIEKKLHDLSKLFAARYDTSFEIYEKDAYFTDIKKVINNTVDELLIVQKGSRHLTDKLFRRFLINDLVFEGETPLIVLP